MKVVWVSHSGGLLGAERCLLEGVRGVAARGVEVHAVVPAPGLLTRCLSDMRVSFSVVPTSLWMSRTGSRSPLHPAWHLYRILTSWRTLAKLLARTRPDVVITNTLTIPFGALAARLARLPHVWYLHELGEKDHGLRFDFGNGLSLRLVDRLSRRIVVTSATVQRHFATSLPRAKLRLIHPAVDVPRVPGIATNGRAFNLALVGAVVPGKRQEDAVRAVALLAGRGLGVRLTIVGNGSRRYLAELRRLVRDLHLEQAVAFAGFTSEPLAHLASCDAALVCSRYEAFGRVTVEAMKLGKPVVGADRGGTAELVKDGWNGLLYEAENPEDLGRKIETLYHDRALARELGRNAQRWSTEVFSIERYTDALLGVLDEAIHADR